MAQTYSIPQRRGIPAWLAFLVIAICLAAAGYFSWKFVFKAKDNAIVAQLDLPNGRPPRDWTVSTRQRAPQFRPDVPDGVSRSTSSWSQAIYARKGNTALIGKPDGPDKPYKVTLTFLDADSWVNSRQKMNERMARNLLVTRSQAEYVKLTNDQRGKLQALLNVPPVDLNDQERTQAATLFAAWYQADKNKDAPAKQKASDQLLAAVASADAKYRLPTRDAAVKLVYGIGQVLSEDQLRKAVEWRDRPPTDTSRRGNPSTRPFSFSNGPMTRPATRPTLAPTTRPG